MFTGSINTHLRSVLWQLSERWVGRNIYVACSGNFTVERILAQRNPAEIHGNDISLYSCALGSWLAGRTLPISVKDDAYRWLEPYLADGLSAVGVLMLCTEWFKYAGRKGAYYERMDRVYRDDFAALHRKTVARITKATDGIKLASFTAADLVTASSTFTPSLCHAGLPATMHAPTPFVMSIS